MTTIELYHANWCGHCKNFMPEWKKLKSMAKDVTLKEYEESANPEEMKKNGITGYPTIKITSGGKTHDYHGARTAQDILDSIRNGGEFVDDDNQFAQCGGGNDEMYKKKYHKYKTKYMQLKK